MTDQPQPPGTGPEDVAALSKRVAGLLSRHRPAGDASSYLTCSCGQTPDWASDVRDERSIKHAAVRFEQHQAAILAEALTADLQEAAARMLKRLLTPEQKAEALAEIEQFYPTPPPGSEMARALEAGQDMQMVMVKPSDCALFVIVGMDGVVQASAVAMSKVQAGGVLRYLGKQWDPEEVGAEGMTVRDRAPVTRPNGDPL